GYLNCQSAVLNNIIKTSIAFGVNQHNYELIPIEVKTKRGISIEKKTDIPDLLLWGKEAIESKKAQILDAIEHHKFID
ncbi:MAG: hypothetical protein AAFO07_08120, partial [Bacteroidota bacterium]